MRIQIKPDKQKAKALIEMANITQEHDLGESSRIFIQQMREYRNRIAYEGFMINENYIKLNKMKLNKIINKLLALQKEK